MMYDFSKIIDRRHQDSFKWDVEDRELAMWVADMDFEAAPEIIQALQTKIDHGIFGYQSIPDAYYKSIHDWWLSHHQMDFETEWMIFCTGVVPAISSMVRKLSDVGENVLIQAPVYNIFYPSILNNGRHILSNDLILENGSYHIDFHDLEEKLSDPQTTLMLLCNPHNPIGKIWDKKTLQRIGELCAKHHVIVISDEIHCDLCAPGHAYIPFASVSSICRDISITCVSASKTFNLAGLQAACIIVSDPQLRHKVMRGINTDEIAEPNSFAIGATIAAFTQGDAWLQELRNYLQTNKELVQHFIETKLPELQMIAGEATYLLWCDCSKITTQANKLLAHIRRETGLYLSSGEVYGKNSEAFFRMNIACPKERVLDGCHRLYQGIQSYKAKNQQQRFI